MVKVSPNGESFVLSSDCVGIIITIKGETHFGLLFCVSSSAICTTTKVPAGIFCGGDYGLLWLL